MVRHEYVDYSLNESMERCVRGFYLSPVQPAGRGSRPMLMGAGGCLAWCNQSTLRGEKVIKPRLLHHGVDSSAGGRFRAATSQHYAPTRYREITLDYRVGRGNTR